MNNRRGNVVLGAIFVIIGVLLLLKTMNILDIYINIFDIGFLISRFWPAFFLIIPGLAFHYGFARGGRRDPGLLVPGGILLVLGIVFQINMLFGGWHILWPGYIFAVAFGLFELYLFGNRDKGLLIPVGILGGLSIIFFTSFSLKELFSFSVNRFLIPLVLIVIGLIIVFRGDSRRKDF